MTDKEYDIILLGTALKSNINSSINIDTITSLGQITNSESIVDEIILKALKKGVDPLGILENGQILSVNRNSLLFNILDSCQNEATKEQVWKCVSSEKINSLSEEQRVFLMHEFLSEQKNEEVSKLFKKGWTFTQGTRERSPEMDWASYGWISFFELMVENNVSFDYSRKYKDSWDKDKEFTLSEFILDANSDELKPNHKKLISLLKKLEIHSELNKSLEIKEISPKKLKI